MKNIVVYVKTVKAEQRIADCAIRMGLAQAVTTVDCVPSLFVELGRRMVDAVLLDTALATPDPVRFTRAVVARFPKTGVLFAGAASPRLAAMVAAAGALGVLRLPSDDTDELMVAFAQAVIFAQREAEADTGASRRRRAASAPIRLSRREYQVLAALSEGKHNAEIGRDLFVSEDTVKTHVKRLYRKLGARDRAHAVAIGFRSGLVS